MTGRRLGVAERSQDINYGRGQGFGRMDTAELEPEALRESGLGLARGFGKASGRGLGLARGRGRGQGICRGRGRW